jgi:hypothetical protein
MTFLMSYQQYQTPSPNENGFTCGHCGTQAQQHSKDVEGNSFLPQRQTDYHVTTICQVCSKVHLFFVPSRANRFDFKLLYPAPLEAPLPSKDMPEAVQKIYNEARILLPHSPSASCAFLRKALETLLYDYTKIEFLQQSIDKFFKEHHEMRESLDPHFQALKLYGNEAIHIREINESDNKEDALILFECLNHIVKTLITLPKETNNLKLMQKEAKK